MILNPKHTLASVIENLNKGLANGTVVLNRTPSLSVKRDIGDVWDRGMVIHLVDVEDKPQIAHSTTKATIIALILVAYGSLFAVWPNSWVIEMACILGSLLSFILGYYSRDQQRHGPEPADSNETVDAKTHSGRQRERTAHKLRK